MTRVSVALVLASGLSVLMIADIGRSQNPGAEYRAETPKTILELQQFRQTSSSHVRAAGKDGVITLVNLNPAVNVWYLLTVAWTGSTVAEPAWHLENTKPGGARFVLDERHESGLVIDEGNKRYPCDLFGSTGLQQGRSSKLIYYPLCGGRVYLRNPAKGQRTALEAATQFLRDQVWGGEKIVVFFHHLMADRYRETLELQAQRQTTPAGTPVLRPEPALIDPAHTGRVTAPAGLGITLEHRKDEYKMEPGTWYPVAGNPAITVSIIQPNMIAASVLQSYPKLVSQLDTVEAASLCYLIAFDLDRFDLGFSLGTDYPGIGWSDRVPSQMRNPRLAGPDGVGTVAPLVSTGLIGPEDGRRTVAAFTGGFKRTHGAFRYGELALKNHGSHYGFIENGVVFSKLQPGLATIFVLDSGSVEMKTWTEDDNRMLAHIRHARQNGVPLVETDTTQTSVPGTLVTRWGPGNWSGSEDARLRTIRAGVGLQTSHGRRFLIYAVFSDATPSAMARVFQAYRCSYAMLLDMNALEHTYLAVYRRSGSEMSVDHLLKGMSQLDKSGGGAIVPRFLGYPDNRDFFYVMRRPSPELKP
jgi:hypothetical protein